MSARALTRRKERQAEAIGISKLRIKMLENDISMQDVKNRIMEDDNFNITVSAISNFVDHKMQSYVQNKIIKMCEEKGNVGEEEVHF